MPDDLRNERSEVDTQKPPDTLSTQERLASEQSKVDHDQTFFNRNFGIFITAATTILGISLSATQVWVAYIQSDREAQRRASENVAAQLEK